MSSSASRASPQSGWAYFSRLINCASRESADRGAVCAWSDRSVRERTVLSFATSRLFLTRVVFFSRRTQRAAWTALRLREQLVAPLALPLAHCIVNCWFVTWYCFADHCFPRFQWLKTVFLRLRMLEKNSPTYFSRFVLVVQNHPFRKHSMYPWRPLCLNKRQLIDCTSVAVLCAVTTTQLQSFTKFESFPLSEFWKFASISHSSQLHSSIYRVRTEERATFFPGH